MVAVMRYVCGGTDDDVGGGREGGRMIADHFREVMELVRVPWSEEEARREEEEEGRKEDEGEEEGWKEGGRDGVGVRAA